MFGVEPVHLPCIDDENDKEADDGALLRHPKTEGSCAYIWHIEI